jgi:hypothetical protein
MCHRPNWLPAVRHALPLCTRFPLALYCGAVVVFVQPYCMRCVSHGCVFYVACEMLHVALVACCMVLHVACCNASRTTHD